MDPITAIGLVASIVQLIEATSKVIKYVSEVKDAPKERENLGLEAANLMPLLMTLKQRIEADPSNEVWYAGVRSLIILMGPMQQLQEAMEQLGSKLKSRREKLSGHSMWPSDRKVSIVILSRVERLKALTGLALQDDQS